MGRESCGVVLIVRCCPGRGCQGRGARLSLWRQTPPQQVCRVAYMSQFKGDKVGFFSRFSNGLKADGAKRDAALPLEIWTMGKCSYHLCQLQVVNAGEEQLRCKPTLSASSVRQQTRQKKSPCRSQFLMTDEMARIGGYGCTHVTESHRARPPTLPGLARMAAVDAQVVTSDCDAGSPGVPALTRLVA